MTKLYDPKLESYILKALITTEHQQLAYLLRPDDFVYKEARQLFDLIISRLNKNQTVDSSMLEDPSVSVDVVVYFSKIFDEPATNDEQHILEKISQFTEASDMRYAGAKTERIKPALESGRLKNKGEVLDILTNLCDDLTQRHPTEIDTTLGASVKSALDQIERRKRELKVPLGLKKLDNFLHGGIALGELVLFAARPNIGKSVFSIMPALYSAMCGVPTLVAVNEMSKEGMAIRMLSHMSSVSMSAIESKEAFMAGDMDALAVAQAQMEKLPLYFLENAYNPSDVETIIRTRQKLGKPLGLVVLDMAGRMRDTSKRHANRREELSAVSARLFQMSKRYNCTIIATLQISRDGDDKPTLKTLKDTGSWEEDADKVLLMWDDKRDKHTRYVHLAKNRTGDKDIIVPMTLDGRHMTFIDHTEVDGGRTS